MDAEQQRVIQRAERNKIAEYIKRASDEWDEFDNRPGAQVVQEFADMVCESLTDPQAPAAERDEQGAGRCDDALLDFARYLNAAECAIARSPSWRMGQAYFNVLDARYPEIAGEVRGDRYIDPYYDDARLPAFLAFVAATIHDKARGEGGE